MVPMMPMEIMQRAARSSPKRVTMVYMTNMGKKSAQEEKMICVLVLRPDLVMRALRLMEASL